MSLQGKKVIILVEEQYQELEVWYPYYRLIEEGAGVLLIGSGSAKVYKSKCGYPAKVDDEAKNIRGKDVDAVVIPGGWAPDYMRRHPAMVSLVREAYEAGKVVAAICHGGWMLTSANIVRGKKVTSFMAIKDDMMHAGAEYLDQEVVVDGKIITSRKPDDLPAFLKEIIKALND